MKQVAPASAEPGPRRARPPPSPAPAGELHRLVIDHSELHPHRPSTDFDRFFNMWVDELRASRSVAPLRRTKFRMAALSTPKWQRLLTLLALVWSLAGMFLARSALGDEDCAYPEASGRCPAWVANGATMGSTNDSAADVVIAEDGRVFVGGTRSSEGPGDDFLAIAYDAGGAPLWEQTFDGGAAHDEATSIALSPDDSVLVVAGNVQIGNDDEGDPVYTYGVVAYDASTGASQWTSKYSEDLFGKDDASLSDVQISPDGSEVVLSGRTLSSGEWSYTTVALDSDTGEKLWDTDYTGTGFSEPAELAIAPGGGTAYVTGFGVKTGAPDVSTDPRDILDGEIVHHEGDYEFVTIAYDTGTGEEKWRSAFNAPGNVDDIATGIGLSPDGGSVFVTGSSHETPDSPPAYATVSYSAADGAQQWQSWFSGTEKSIDDPTDLVVAHDGTTVFVTGENNTFIDDQHLVAEHKTVAYSAETGGEQWVATDPGPLDDSSFMAFLAVSQDDATIYLTHLDAHRTEQQDYQTTAFDASNGSTIWSQKYAGPSGGDQVTAIAPLPHDHDGVVVTGTSFGSDSTDVATVAYDGATDGQQLWVGREDDRAGGNLDQSWDVGMSPDGTRVYVAGWTGAGRDPLGAAKFAYLITAYNAKTGAVLWQTHTQRDGAYDHPIALTVAPDGKHVYVTGFSDTPDAPTYAMTVAYTAATGAEEWKALYDDPDQKGGMGRDVVVSPDGSTVYITGESYSDTSGDDCATIAYDATTGARKWISRYNAQTRSRDLCWALTTSPDGNSVAIAGDTFNSPAPGAGDQSFATVVYDAATGDQRWTKATDGAYPGGFDGAVDAVFSPDSSRLFVTGSTRNAQGDDDMTTIAYDGGSGTELWREQFGGDAANNDRASSVLVSPDGQTVFVVGTAIHRIVSHDYDTFAYDASTGGQIWHSRYDSLGAPDQPTDAVLSDNGERIYVTGTSPSLSGKLALATVGYDTSQGDEQWVARYDGAAPEVDFAAWLAVGRNDTKAYVAGTTVGSGDDDMVLLAYNTGTGGPEPPDPSPDPTLPPPPTGHVTTTLSSSDTRPSQGEGLTLEGVVGTTDGPCTDVQVTVQRSLAGADFTSQKILDVDSSGRWSMDVTARNTATYRAKATSTNCVGDVSHTILVKVPVRIVARLHRCARGVHGYVVPNKRGTRVLLQRRRTGEWRTVEVDHLNGASEFVLSPNDCSDKFRVVWPRQDKLNESASTRVS